MHLIQDSAVARTGAPITDRLEHILKHLTPVEERHGVWFKRDDLFRPFAEDRVNGGKLRQCLTLISRIQAPGIISASSIHSPQVVIVAAAAQALRKKCVILVGGMRETVETQLARSFGARIERCASGRHSVLFHHAKTLQHRMGYAVVPYGMSDGSLVGGELKSTSMQVRNLPAELDNLVVTCGSGTTAIGILHGLSVYANRVQRLVLFGTGPNRSRRIDLALTAIQRNVGGDLRTRTTFLYHSAFEQPGFRYERREPFSLHGIDLHPLYEAKAFRWAAANLSTNDKTLYWVIGR